MTNENSLTIVSDKITVLAEKFSGSHYEQSGKIEDILDQIERYVKSVELDATTEPGRKAIKSLARKVSSSKTLLESLGKEQKADILIRGRIIDAGRNLVKDRLDTLRDAVLKPVRDYDAIQERRVQGHQQVIEKIHALAVFDEQPDESMVRGRIAELGPLMQRDFEEFEAVAIKAHQETEERLETHLQAAELRRIKREQQEAQERAEAEAARQKAEQERIEREKRIAEEAAAKAKADAEAKAERERLAAIEAHRAEQERVERERREQQERIARMEREAAERAEREKREAAARELAHKEALERAERQRIADQEAAERRQHEVVEAERQRIAAAAAAKAAEDQRRAENKKHRAKISNEVLKAMMEAGASEGISKTLINAIVRGEIPHVSISY